MIGDKRNYSLSLWDHKDNFLCLLKSSNSNVEGGSYDESFSESITGEKTLTFSIPMYIFSPKDRFEKNSLFWDYIKTEQKIRYIEYSDDSNEPIRIEEFVLKNYSEERSGEEKIAYCTCESLAVYELGKVGWGISFDTDYITTYESQNSGEGQACADLLTLDYWLRKIFYKESNLGRVSTPEEATWLLQGLQLRDDEGYPISQDYTTTSEGKREYTRVEEPVCESETDPNFTKYYNPTGWCWEVRAKFENDPDKQDTPILYESPTISKYIEILPNYYEARSYQKLIGQPDDTKELRKHPIEDRDLATYTYVTDIKRRLFSVERSNIFSIIQDMCETFEIWAYFQYTYSLDGKITERKILFKTEAFNDEIKFDFAYGKNLQSCSRVINSQDLITKLIVPMVDSSIVDGNVLSIQQSTANPTGENYLYNFDYFYQLGNLTKEADKPNDIQSTDEYKINLHAGKLRNLNNKISDLQKILLPLYDKQDEIQSELTIAEGEKDGYIANIQDIQNKIRAIPPKDAIVNSWSKDTHQYNHIGAIKTFTLQSPPGRDEEYHYINFNRDDIIFKAATIKMYDFDDEGNISEATGSIELPEYLPRMFNYNNSWRVGNEEASESDFTILDQDGERIIYDYSELTGTNGSYYFLKGIYIKDDPETSYCRIRYKYAPLAYYYLLIKDYIEKENAVDVRISSLEKRKTDIDNRILAYELELKKYLQTKNELILQFEKNYKPFIREGFWEPSSYQSQLEHEVLNTSNANTNYDGLFTTITSLSDLNYNDSLTNFSYAIKVDKLDNVKIDSISMSSPEYIGVDKTLSYFPRYRGQDYELYYNTDEYGGSKYLWLAIAPDFLTKLQKSAFWEESLKRSDLSYETAAGEKISIKDTPWLDLASHTIMVEDSRIYLSNDNILTSSLAMCGVVGSEEIPLELYTDYTYVYESTAYNSKGERKDVSEWVVDEQAEDLHYDYSLKIEFKITDNVNKIISNNGYFIVDYDEESTLQYLYNDAYSTSEKYAFPQTEYSVSVIDLSTLNGYEDYRPVIGQKVPIWDLEMGYEGFEGFITSIQYDLEQRQNTAITITTYNTKFEDIFQKLTATMTNVSYNENQIYNAAKSFDIGTGTIKATVFQKSLDDNFNRITLGTDNDITIDRRTGITLRDVNSSNAVKLIGNGIFLSNNVDSDSPTWVTGITGDGINADTLSTGTIDTKQVNIWNASEGQIRFRWNELGLFAFSDSATSPEEEIDYNRFIRFNQDGLDFSDGGKSALSLNWGGLKINTQDNSLVLDAETGLTLQEWNGGTATTRLHLGKLDDGNIYGLKLKNKKGDTSFQSDSDGDLWLSKFIKVGGSFDDKLTDIHVPTYTPLSPNAGISGLEGIIDTEYQMGPKRNEDGDMVWSSNNLRFWAGPRTIAEYDGEEETPALEDFPEIFTDAWQSSHDLSQPLAALSRFKVDSRGQVVASGIDVGGWIGGGTFLRSKDGEAVLRSGKYGESGTNADYPVLAIGRSIDYKTIIPIGTPYYGDHYLKNLVGTTTEEIKLSRKRVPDFYSTQVGIIVIGGVDYYIDYGSLPRSYYDPRVYNFRVYRSGGLRIGWGRNGSGAEGNDPLIITPYGEITATLLNIKGSSTFTSGTMAGFTVTSKQLSYTQTGSDNKSYQTILRAPTSSTDITFASGPTGNPSFKVLADGAVTASDITITGSSSNWIINSDYFQVSKYGQIGAGFDGDKISKMPDVFPTKESENYYKFSVDKSGTIRFRGDIKAYANDQWWEGLNGASIKFQTTDSSWQKVQVVQGLIVGIKKV